MARPLQLHDLDDKYLLWQYLSEKEAEVSGLRKDLDEARSKLSSASQGQVATPTPTPTTPTTPTTPAKPPVKVLVDPATLTAIRDALSVSGSVPLAVDGLRGILGQPQYPLIPRLTTLPNAQSTLYSVVAVTGTSTDTIYILDRNVSPHVWHALASVPANMVTTDTNQSISGQKTFTTTQLVAAAVDAALELKVTNSSGGTAAQVEFEAINDIGVSGSLRCHGSGRVLTRYGAALANAVEVVGFNGSSALFLGSQDNAPIIFGTNNIERGRYNGDGSWQRTMNNGAVAKTTTYTELVTLSTVGTTTDSATNLVPGNCLVRVVLVFVQTGITGAGVTNVQVGDATVATRWGNIGTISLGASVVCLNHMQGSIAADNAGPVNFTASKIRLTAVGGTPTAGKVRIVVVADEFTAPTS